MAKGSTLNIKSGTEEFKLENNGSSAEKAKIQFNKAHNGTVDVKLLSGDVKLVDKKEESCPGTA